MTQLPTLRLLETRRAELRLLSDCLREAASHHTRALCILEAGCGAGSDLEFDDVPHVLTGIDEDADALAARGDDLDRRIVGDLRSVALEEEHYDVVYSSFVLEHVAGAEEVLIKLCRALRPGGLLLLRIPDRDSVYALVSRRTPLWLHALFRRRLGLHAAGTAGHGPYPTVYDRVVSRRGVHRFCARHGLTIRGEFGTNHFLQRPGWVTVLARGVVGLVHLVSLGRFAADHNNLTYIIQKPGTAPDNAFELDQEGR